MHITWMWKAQSLGVEAIGGSFAFVRGIAEHRNRSAYIVHLANGAISAGCHHSGCQAKDWQALRDLVEPGWRKQYQSPTPDNSGPSRDWEPPIPFDQFNLPTFPTVAFPDWLRSFVEAEARATQPSLRKERIWEEFVVLGAMHLT